jgi:DNA-binding response OmpR family regulator/EAL domain-containing protein (putative c-di-GMP-specific phosphodiesterase class I)
MNDAILIYSLTENLKKLNPSLMNDINVVDSIKLEELLRNIKPNAVIFDTEHMPYILSIIHHDKIRDTRFICVGENLSTDDRLILLNHNIEFITPEKFVEISTVFFQLEPEQKSYKVLFVEDDKDQITITEHILQNANIDVMSISKGEEVLEALERFKPDLILMDLYLDGITGDKLVKIIRKINKYRFLPIVFITSDTTIESRMLVLNAGADDLLTKPINSELLVSALINRMQRNYIHESKLKQEKEETVVHNVVHNVVDTEHVTLDSFVKKNALNNEASIIWVKVINKQSLQKKLGYSGFKNLCTIMFSNIPLFNKNFTFKLKLTDGIFAIGCENLGRKNAQVWVEKLQKWLSRNYFSLNKKDYYFEVIAIILSDIPAKKDKDKLINKAEHILIDAMSSKPITLLEEGIEEKRFYLIKTQLENSIKTRNFKWQYQSIISTTDENQEIYQLMLKIITDSGKELNSADYMDVANKTGLLRLLDRFTLEHAIRIIRSGELKQVETRTLLNQVLSDYQSKELRFKKLNVIKNLNLPLGSMIFQFTQEDAIEYMSILGEVGRDINSTKIKICLSNFDCSSAGWKIARKLNVSWIRIKEFEKNTDILDVSETHDFSKSVRKAHTLGYKVIVSRVDSAGLAADLWKLKIDYLQGNFIQAPIKDIFSS